MSRLPVKQTRCPKSVPSEQCKTYSKTDSKTYTKRLGISIPFQGGCHVMTEDQSVLNSSHLIQHLHEGVSPANFSAKTGDECPGTQETSWLRLCILYGCSFRFLTRIACIIVDLSARSEAVGVVTLVPSCCYQPTHHPPPHAQQNIGRFRLPAVEHSNLSKSVSCSRPDVLQLESDDGAASQHLGATIGRQSARFGQSQRDKFLGFFIGNAV